MVNNKHATFSAKSCVIRELCFFAKRILKRQTIRAQALIDMEDLG